MCVSQSKTQKPTHPPLHSSKPHTLWNHDSPSAYPGPNMYGSWPVLMDVRPDGRAHAILLVNSNGMDVTLSPDSATFRVIGGVLDFYVLVGPTPLAVHDQITQIIGRPFLPPYWSLGLMQSKYGYQSVDEFETAVSGYANASLPLETFVADSQYMDNDQDFTLGEKFPADRMRAFTSRLHAAGQRFVPILDPVIHIAKGYDPYDRGMKAGIFVKDQTGSPYVAQLWPGAAHLPDYMHPAAPSWWRDQIKTMFDDGLNPDGIWLDMNEVSNYCSGDVCKATRRVPPNNKFVCELVCESGPSALGHKANPPLPPGLYIPPYAINNGEDETPLGHKTLPVTARHHGGVLEYDVHNLYGHIQSIHTAAAMRNLTGKRAFVFTRSSFLGTGAVAAHWTGDTASTWDDMRNSVPMLFQSGLAGIPFVGADICGFMKYASEELCSRWAALGAWYPYSRNHHADGYQEFWRWPKVAEAARNAYAWRYKALPHMYTAFADARARGCPVARPLLYSWPADANLTNVYEQIMVGDGLLASPVLKGGRTAVDAYFPRGTWHSLLDGSTIDARAGGKTVTLDVGLTDAPPLHIAGGAIIPLGGGGLTTRAARASALTIVAALPRPGAPVWQRCGEAPPPPTDGVLTATGSMFYDDGDSVEVGPPRTGSRAAFALRVVDATAATFSGSFNITWPTLNGDATCDASLPAWPTLDDVKIVGVAPARASSVRVSLVPRAGAPRSLTPKFVSYDDATGTLRVGGLRLALECGTDVRVTFDGSGTGGGRVKDVSSKRPIRFDPSSCDCDDVAPTPDFTCPQQAAYGKCGDGFMYGYCKKSCGGCKCDTEAGTPAPPKKGSQFSQ